MVSKGTLGNNAIGKIDFLGNGSTKGFEKVCYSSISPMPQKTAFLRRKKKARNKI